MYSNDVNAIVVRAQVNKIRELPDNPSIVATHSDAKEVFVWHFDRQPHRGDKVQLMPISWAGCLNYDWPSLGGHKRKGKANAAKGV